MTAKPKLKKAIRTVLLISAVCVLAAVSAFAYSDADFEGLPFIAAEGFVTEIRDLDGGVHRFDGALDAEALEEDPAVADVSSYALLCADGEVLSVELHDVGGIGAFSVAAAGTQTQNGYYSVRFAADEYRDVFLTGLTNAGVAQVQTEIVSARLDGRVFDMEAPDFIDAEKVYDFTNFHGEADRDSELCWAATAANILYYTGWDARAGFPSADYLFELLGDAFTNAGSQIDNGLQWFFNGYNPDQGGSSGAQLNTYDGSFNGFLPQYAAENLFTHYDCAASPETLPHILSCLENECGVGIAIDFLLPNGNRISGHAISLWGYITDSRYPEETDKAHWAALIVSDSDSDVDVGGERRCAPNVLTVAPLTAHENKNSIPKYDTWRIGGYKSAVLRSFTVLQPCSADAPTETGGTKNKILDPDLIPTFLSIAAGSEQNRSATTVFNPGEDVCIVTQFKNAGHATVPAGAELEYTVRILQGETVVRQFTQTVELRADLKDDNVLRDWNTIRPITVSGLPAGTYTVTAAINPDGAFTEAYVSNNTVSKEITILAQYDPASLSFSAVPSLSQGNDRGTSRLSFSGDLGSFGPAAYLIEEYYYDSSDHREYSGTVYEGPSFPTEPVALKPVGSEVQYRLTIRSADKRKANIVLYSERESLSYTKFSIHAHPDNTEVCTPLPSQATSLASGEALAFSIVNESTGSDAADCAYRIFLVNKGDLSVQIPLCTGSTSLFPQGVEEISLSVFDAVVPDGAYDVWAEISYKDGAELSGEQISEIQFSVPEFSVNLAGAAIADDFRFRVNATATFPLNRDCFLDLSYYDAAQTEEESQIRRFSDLEYSTSGACRASCFIELLPGHTYCYQVVLCELLDLDEYGDDYDGEGFREYFTPEGWIEVTMPGITPITASDPGEASLGNDETAGFRFVAPAAGSYVFSLSGPDAILRYSPERDDWVERSGFGKGPFSEYAFSGSGSVTVKLEEDQPFYLYLAAKAEGTYSVSVAPYTTAFSAGPATVRGDILTQTFSVSATVPLHSSFGLGVEYGIKGEPGTAMRYAEISNSKSEYASETIRLDLLPGTTYSYRTYLVETETGAEHSDETWEEFTTPALGGELLQQGAVTVSLESAGLHLYRFRAEEAGSYTFSFSGPDGILMCWDADGETWSSELFTAAGTETAMELAASETRYFILRATVPGDYTIQLKAIRENTVGFSIFPGETASPASLKDSELGVYNTTDTARSVVVIAAHYDSAGKLLSLEKRDFTLQSREEKAVALAGSESAARTKIFLYDGSGLSPLADALLYTK